MSRFSKAGVEMITCAMGQAMCSKFNVPPGGQKRVTDAISKLKAYSSYGQVLWFGFGVKHIVRSLCETKQGTTCAALCACLRVSYSTEMSARVLSELCDQLLPSDGLSPALPQWAALIDVCSGALSPSKFPVMVDGFCRLAFRDRRPYSQFHNATTVDALARALAELSKVSNGSVSSITFQGGYDCGWIAAVAEWLLCLRVKVLTEEGSCLYWQDSSHTSGSAQVIIIFNAHTHDPELAETKGLRVVNRSFRLPCNGGVEIVRRADAAPGELFGIGRSSWSTILEDTFGNAFKMLLSSNIVEPFTKMLLSDITAHNFDNPTVFSYNRREMIHRWMGPFSCPAASQERAFFLAIANQLPELSPLLEALEQVQKSAGAAAGPEKSQLWKFCDCEFCRQHNQGKPSWERRIRVTKEICLYHLVLTLIDLIRLLVRINVDENIEPASAGLLMLYDYVATHDIDYLYSFFSTYERDENAYFDAFQNTPDIKVGWDADLDTMYQRTFELFTGLPTHKSLTKLVAASALCRGGICIWLPALEDPLYDPAEQMRLRVAPGKVSFRDRLYREVVDMEESDVSDQFDSILPGIADHGISRICTLIVRETVDVSQLEAWIELSSRKTSSDFNAYLHAIGVKHRQILPSELRLPIKHFYGQMDEKIHHRTCEINLGCARSRGLPMPDLTTWERPCPSLALKWEANASLKRSCNYPEAGEWVLVQASKYDQGVMIFRGDFSLLYYLASVEDNLSALWLSCFDGCIRCLAYNLAWKEEDYHCEEYLIEVHTITEKECTRWLAKMTGRLPEDRLDPHHGDNHSTPSPLDETGSSTGSLDDDTGEGGSTVRRQFHALPARSACEDGRRRSY